MLEAIKYAIKIYRSRNKLKWSFPLKMFISITMGIQF
jgi:hypothetical protein